MKSGWSSCIALMLLAACSKHPAATRPESKVTTAAPAATASTKIGFACEGKEDGNLGSSEKMTRHFVLEGERLFELSDQSGKLEDSCDDHPCRMRVTPASIDMLAAGTDEKPNGMTEKTGDIISINRLTGELYESASTSFTSATDGHTSELKRSFAGTCVKEEPKLEIQPKF